MDESVLKGNTAIFKCHIPSFVSDYVQVTSWLQDDSHEIVPEDKKYGVCEFFIFKYKLCLINCVFKLY